MQSIPKVYPHEHYRCAKCAKDLIRSDISDSWTCVVCTGAVLIYASDHAGLRRILSRQNPFQLREGSLVVVPTAGLAHVHEVIRVTLENDAYRVALRSYRTVNLAPDVIVECAVGEW
jgi:hypothetical protein